MNIKHISIFFENNLIQQNLRMIYLTNIKQNLKLTFSKKLILILKTVTIDFSTLMFSFKEKKIPFSELLKSISASDYSKSIFQDERNELNISDEDNLF